MKISRDGVYLIQHFEGLKLQAYRDIAGYATIGIGHRMGAPAHLITTSWENALEVFDQDLSMFETGIIRLLDSHPVSQGQFDALASFSFNEGLSRLATSTLLLKFFASEIPEAADEFLEWDKAIENGRLTYVSGLERRRNAERALFLGQDFRPFLKDPEGTA